MKNCLFTIIFLLSVASTSAASNIITTIDPRSELTSIVFRLTGAEEYVTDRATNYLTIVDDYFSEYSNHPLIRYIKEIRDQYRLYYGKVAGMSFLFKIQNSHIVPISNNAVKLWITEYWNTESADKYYQLLDDFYSDSNFELFWNSISELREKAMADAEKTLELMNINLGWYDSFFGETLNDVEIIVSLANGRHNYASGSFMDEGNCRRVVLGCNTEIEGIPSLGRDCTPIITHEICHTIGNSIIETHLDEFTSFDRVYKHINHITKKYGYGDNNPTTAIIESLNDLFCTEYLLFSNYADIGYHIADLEERGYLWMSDLVRFMDNFHSHRDVYPSIKEFMPQIVAYYNDLPDRFDAIMANDVAKCPYIESTYPANGSTVPVDLSEIRIALSQPVIDAYGQKRIEGIKPIPWGNRSLSDDHKTIIFQITKPLEPGKTYGIDILGFALISEKTYHRASKNYRLIFKVK